MQILTNTIRSATLLLISSSLTISAEEMKPFAARLTPLGPILDLSQEGYGVWDCSPIRDDTGRVHVFFTRFPVDEKEGWFKNFRTDSARKTGRRQPEGVEKIARKDAPREIIKSDKFSLQSMVDCSVEGP